MSCLTHRDKGYIYIEEIWDKGYTYREKYHAQIVRILKMEKMNEMQ